MKRDDRTYPVDPAFMQPCPNRAEKIKTDFQAIISVAMEKREENEMGLISKEEVLKRIEYHQNNKVINRIKTVYAFEMLKSDIEDIPEIEERKEGEWLHAEIIDDDKDFGVNSDATQCSICGDYQESYYWAKTYYHYCPNCGARMKGADDED